MHGGAIQAAILADSPARVLEYRLMDVSDGDPGSPQTRRPDAGKQSASLIARFSAGHERRAPVALTPSGRGVTGGGGPSYRQPATIRVSVKATARDGQWLSGRAGQWSRWSVVLVKIAHARLTQG